MLPHQKSKEELFKELQTSEKGITPQQAKEKLKEFGKNEIKRTHRLRPIKILLQQFNSFLIYILIVAAAMSFLIKHNIDGAVITAIIFINAAIGFFQQYKAEKAIINLRKFLIPKSKVLRAGVMIEIPSLELVPGDILLLSAGDKVNADCRIIEAENLQTNEASLTGESLPIDKFTEIISKEVPLAERKNQIFMGTSVVRGTCKALVISTGMKTEFGKIAETIQEIEVKKTPMQKRLDKFSKQIGFIILGIIAIIIILGVLEHFDLKEMFFTAVALAVSAIPEGLPAVMAIAFAIASVAMSKTNVIVRRLPAVESLGSVTVICSDKTGTITEEKMSIEKIFSANTLYTKKDKELFLKNKKLNPKLNKELNQLIKTSILCNNARYEIVKDKYEIIGDPTENALVQTSLDLGFDKKTLIESEPSVKKLEFDSKRKMMSVMRTAGRGNTIYSKGAIEKILQASSFEMINGQQKELTPKRKKEILEQSREIEKQAYRVLAFAFKNTTAKGKLEEKGLTFLGFVGMIDPPRKEVAEAIKQCHDAGIKVKMITGDSLLTATAIAKQIGIIGQSITEDQLEKMSDEDLSKAIDKIAVFARTSPTQKLRITNILQQNGEVVAITGDGVNDALALKSADIGIAMGIRGTDVSRDVSDIVLIDDNFASIVEGVKQGRRTYDNIKKFTKYFLAVNFDEILLVAMALLLRFPLPLLPLQILWINLITDSLPALTLSLEKEEGVMKTKPRQEKSILDGIWRFVIIAGIFAFFIGAAVYFLGLQANMPIEKIRTMVLTTTILFELFFVYTCRSDKFLGRNIFSNKWMNYAVLFSIAMHLILIYTPLGQFFSVVPLGIKDWLLILPFAISGLAIFEIRKLIKSKSA
jgi:P-type Ca2+ transporter type 2C